MIQTQPVQTECHRSTSCATATSIRERCLRSSYKLTLDEFLPAEVARIEVTRVRI